MQVHDGSGEDERGRDIGSGYSLDCGLPKAGTSSKQSPRSSITTPVVLMGLLIHTHCTHMPLKDGSGLTKYLNVVVHFGGF